MKIIKSDHLEANIEISSIEISALKQVLNELCHGLKIDNFEQKIGVSKQEVKEILSYISDLKERIPQSGLLINSSSVNKLNNNINQVIRKKCCLKANKYNCLFYMRKLDFSTEEVGLVIALLEKDNNELIVKTDAKVVSTKELQKIFISFRNKINSWNFNRNNYVFCSFFNEIVQISINNTELSKSNSTDESSITINFIFKLIKDCTNLTTTTTLNNIVDFITSVEDFLVTIRGVSQNN